MFRPQLDVVEGNTINRGHVSMCEFARNLQELENLSPGEPPLKPAWSRVDGSRRLARTVM